MTIDIICAKCGKHFNSVDSARNHQEHCKESAAGEIYFIPSITIISAAEIGESLKNETSNQNIVTKYCPLKKEQSTFPCPRCCYSTSESEIKDFLKTITWWYCKYPKIVKLSMLQPEDIMNSSKE